MVEFITGVGRIVWGQNPLKPTPVLDDNKAQKLDKAGQPRTKVSFGVAFPKAEFQALIWPQLHAVAAQAFNNQIPPSFAYKYVDGDGVDANGQSYATRPGYAGCYVLSVSTEVGAPPLFQFDGTKYNQMPADALKCGDYVALGLDVVYNGQRSPNKPGLYINPKIVQFVGYGEHIASQGGADPMAMFKGQQFALPAGASATPVAGAMGMPGMGMPQQPAMAPQPMMQQPTMAPQPMMAPAAQPAPMGMPAPAPDFLQPAMAPQPMMAPAAQPMGMPQPMGMQQPMAQPAPMGMPGMMPPR